MMNSEVGVCRITNPDIRNVTDNISVTAGKVKKVRIKTQIPNIKFQIPRGLL
jgi:hypothetical protein